MADAQLTNAVIATTLDHYISKLEDQIFNHAALLFALKSAGRIESRTGNKIHVPLLYAEASNKGSYGDGDTFTQNAETGIGNAAFTWKRYYVLVGFEGLELAQNKGKEAILSLLRARLTQQEMTASENLNKMFLSDGTGNEGKDWGGLEAYVGTQNNTVGGIDSTVNTWWNPQFTASAGALTQVLMRDAYNSASKGNMHPNFILTDQERYEDFEDLLDDNARFLDPELASGGFVALQYKGAPVVFDVFMPSGHMYFLTMDFLELTRDPDVWFKPSEMLVPTNQDKWYKTMLCYGNLVVSNRNRQGALTGLT